MKRFFRRIAAVTLSLALLVTTASALSVEEALTLLDETYLREVPEQARQAESLDELFALLGDPYTCYMTAEDFEGFLTAVDGTQSLVGIGVSIQYTEEGILILDVIDGGAAQRAGLAAGDLIVAVDGTSCVPADESHQALIAGQAETFVTLTVLRDGVTRDYALMRQEIVIPNTTFSLEEGGIGYIQCTSFGMDSDDLTAEALSRYDGEVTHWVLDLRSNSGGYTDAAVSMLGTFAGPGYYLFLRDKGGYTAGYAHLSNALTESPVIVLTNAFSASASEAVAAGIRDTGRGIVIGSRTYGKGVAQVLLDSATHPDLFTDDALKVTAYRFYSQRGNTTDAIGVIPTLMVADEDAEAVAAALCGAFRDDYVTEGQLMLSIAGQYFFIDLDELADGTASALLSALPPSAQLWVGEDTYYWDEITVGEAAALLNVSYTDRGFDDVNDSPYADEINTLSTYALLLGDGTGQFRPEGQLTRAQACAMLAQTLNLSCDGPSFFTDVDGDAWYAGAVNAMAELGLVEGTGGGKFNPDGLLSQQEYLTILGRLARWLNFNVDGYRYSFYDSEGNYILDLLHPELSVFAPWAREEVAVLDGCAENLGRYGTMLFTDLSELEPDAPILREEAAASLYRVLNLTGILNV